MHSDVLIIGQGISGTMLGWFLQKEGISFRVLDERRENAPSQVAGGIINPVTGRKYHYSWMIETIMPFAVKTYGELGRFLDCELIRQKDAIEFFPNVAMRDAFIDRMAENDTYLSSYPDQNHFNQYFHYAHGCGLIRPAYVADLQLTIERWGRYLEGEGRLHADRFAWEHLELRPEGVRYREFSADKIIFCDGIASLQHPIFAALPFAPSKGEALLIEAPELTNEHIFKRGMLLAPLSAKGCFWVGSSYQWKYEHAEPTEAFIKGMKAHLDDWMKVPYTITAHKAALRPSTLERRPFVGLHPHFPAAGLLNGMGTKGTSLAPFFAQELARHLAGGAPITPEADVARFRKILAR
ncbi:MAG TPA: FAD-dependent oxidoreductase [Chitinophagaceae bacterium]|jgi:glycine/D-amino acid oxidase-like deaminating enzyme|nr:FAD-dependent oxidoreductase [Chitinophagaceae bacterium]